MTSPLLEMMRLGRLSEGRHVDALALAVEEHLAVHEGEQGPIAAGADVLARDKLRTALTHDDAAGADDMAAIFFHAKTLADAIASVAATALSFFMCHKFLSVDGFDLHHGQLLAVTGGLMIALAAAHLERDDLVTTLMLDHIGHNICTTDERRAHRYLAVVVDQQDTVKRDRLASLDLEAFNLQLITRSNAVLLPTSFDDSVHKSCSPLGPDITPQTPPPVNGGFHLITRLNPVQCLYGPRLCEPQRVVLPTDADNRCKSVFPATPADETSGEHPSTDSRSHVCKSLWC